jgi:hypothetical protein
MEDKKDISKFEPKKVDFDELEKLAKEAQGMEQQQEQCIQKTDEQAQRA